MYDHPVVRGETDAFWAAIRDRLRAEGVPAPETLTRADDIVAQWSDPGLLLGQTCGLPFRCYLHDAVTLVGSIDYGLEGIPPGFYHSYFVARADDPRTTLDEFTDAVLAYNEPNSHSGWAAAVRSGVRFRVGAVSGSHRASIIHVADGSADIAAIDAISWGLMERYAPETRALKIVGCSAPTPGMALITAFPEHAPSLRRAIAAGIEDLPSAARTGLGLRGFVQIPVSSYRAVPNPPVPEAYSLAIA